MGYISIKEYSLRDIETIKLNLKLLETWGYRYDFD